MRYKWLAILVFTLANVLVSTSVSNAEIRKGYAKYIMQTTETYEQATEKAIAKARVKLSNEIGLIVESKKVVVNGILTESQSKVISQIVMKDRIKPQVKRSLESGNIVIEAAIEVDVDMKGLEKMLKKALVQDNRIEEQQRDIEISGKKIAKLELENKSLKEENDRARKIESEYVQKSIEKLKELKEKEKWDEIVKECNEYISLYPKYAEFYGFRADAFYQLACDAERVRVGRESVIYDFVQCRDKWGNFCETLYRPLYTHSFFGKSIIDYEKAYKLSNDSTYCSKIVMPLNMLGYYDRAIEYIRKIPNENRTWRDFNNYYMLHLKEDHIEYAEIVVECMENLLSMEKNSTVVENYILSILNLDDKNCNSLYIWKAIEILTKLIDRFYMENRTDREWSLILENSFLNSLHFYRMCCYLRIDDEKKASKDLKTCKNVLKKYKEIFESK